MGDEISSFIISLVSRVSFSKYGLRDPHRNHPGCLLKMQIPGPTLYLLPQNIWECGLGIWTLASCPGDSHSFSWNKCPRSPSPGFIISRATLARNVLWFQSATNEQSLVKATSLDSVFWTVLSMFPLRWCHFRPFHLLWSEPAVGGWEAQPFAGLSAEVARADKQGASLLLVSACKDELL